MIFQNHSYTTDKQETYRILYFFGFKKLCFRIVEQRKNFTKQKDRKKGRSFANAKLRPSEIRIKF